MDSCPGCALAAAVGDPSGVDGVEFSVVAALVVGDGVMCGAVGEGKVGAPLVPEIVSTQETLSETGLILTYWIMQHYKKVLNRKKML